MAEATLVERMRGSPARRRWPQSLPARELSPREVAHQRHALLRRPARALHEAVLGARKVRALDLPPARNLLAEPSMPIAIMMGRMSKNESICEREA